MRICNGSSPEPEANATTTIQAGATPTGQITFKALSPGDAQAIRVD